MIDEKFLVDLRATQEEEGTEFSLADLIALFDGNADEGKEYYQALQDGKKNTAEMPQNTVQINLDNSTTPAEIVQPSNVDTDVTVPADNLDALSADNLRGISIDTYRHYGCSYDILSSRIIIPTILPDGNSSYVKVLTNSKRQEL